MPATLTPQQNAARLSLVANIFLVAIKIGAGALSGSLSVLAEGVQSFLDILASAMILWIVKAASAPPDESHPYGHGKFENLSSLFQLLLIFASIGGIWWSAWQRFQHPQLPQVDIGIAALLVSVAVNFAVSRRVHQVATDTDSSALKAEVVHLRGDLWACAGVLLGLFATKITGEARLDPIFAAFMTLFAFASALHLMRETVAPLVDETLPGDEEEKIRAVLENDSRVLGFHKLRTRQAGSLRLADVHILLDDDLSFREAHRIGEEVEEKIRALLPNMDVMVHTEPWAEETAHQREFH